MLRNFADTAALQSADAAHHVHSFADPKALAAKGTRIITQGKGCYVWDNEGNRLLDGMAGLWCVAVGYGRQELTDIAARQMNELAYYNNHFGTSTPQMIELAEKIAKLTPEGLDHILFANSGSEANDTIVRLVRRYWMLQGKPTKQTFRHRPASAAISAITAARSAPSALAGCRICTAWRPRCCRASRTSCTRTTICSATD